MLPVHHQQAISTLHPLPVIFISSSTTETDLIDLLAIATHSRPSKPMGAKFSRGVAARISCLFLRFGTGRSFGGVIVLKRRVNRFLTTSRAHFQITGVHSGYKLPRS